MEPNTGFFIAGLLAVVIGLGWEEDQRRRRTKTGKLKVNIAGHKFEASGPVWFVVLVFGIFLVALAYIIPG